MSKIFKKNYSLLVFFIFFLIASSIYFWPFLKHPAFNLIDDGTTLQVSKEILSGDLSNLVETQNGRIRSFYWLYFVFIYNFSGINPLGFWIGQTIVFSLTLFSIWYLLIDKANYKKWKSYLVSFSLLTLFFVPAISENLFRLGTAEVRQVLLIIWFMIWMKKSVQKKIPNWVGFLVFLLALLTKETSILLIPMIFVFLFPYIVSNYKKYKDKLCSLLFLSFFSLIFYSLITAMKETSSYSAGFSINLAQMKTNLLISRLGMNEIFYLLFALLSLTFVRFLLLLIKKNVFTNKKENYIFKVVIKFWKKNSLLISSLVGILSSFFFVFSWEYQLERYYYPVYIFLFIYLVLEVERSLKLFSSLKEKKHKVLLIIFPVLVLLFLHTTFFQKTIPNLGSYIVRNSKAKRLWYSDYQSSYSVIQLLILENTGKMYTPIDDYEIVYELGFFTNKLDFEKNKIMIVSPNEEIAKRYDFISSLEDIEKAFLEEKDKSAVLVTVESKNLNLDLDIYTKQVLENNFLDKSSNRSNWVVWRKK